MTPIALSDHQMREVMDAANLVPLDLRQHYLERLALELRDKDLAGADGLVHRLAFQVARSITFAAGRTAWG
jgi:hypothetical protein